MRSCSYLLVLATIVGLAAGAVPAGAGEPPRSRVEPGLLGATAPVDVLARFTGRVPAALERIPGLTVTYRFGGVPAIAGRAAPDAVRALARLPGLAYLESDKPIELDLDSATRASRAKDVWAPETGDPLTDGDGNVVDGRAVGIAIVDVGLDALHPDFQQPGKVGGNYQVTPAGVLPASLPWDSYLDGHGTHVAGIAAGNGYASEGLYRGVAPGSTLYAFDMHVGTVAVGAVAFDWILQNGAQQNPPIRVVNNSWHCSPASCGHPFNPDQLHVQLASALADAGFTITWAAGNYDRDSGNDGFVSNTSAEVHNRTPGIIGVANYDDETATETGVRTSCLSDGSALGAASDPTTWPDVSAPGTAVMSTWAMGPFANTSTGSVTSRNPVDGSNSYRRLTGTSMAAPHVAGIAALMLQANPDLTPAGIEYILKQTSTQLDCGVAYVRADAAHPWSGANYAEGHGLVDARTAVLGAAAFTGIPDDAPGLEPLPDDFLSIRHGIEPEEILYLSGDAALTPSYPDAERRATIMPPNQLLSFTSDPLAAPVATEAIKVDAYVGSTAEVVAVLNPPRLRVRVFKVSPDGTTQLAGSDTRMWQIGPLGPTQRDLAYELDEPVTFAAGDKVRVDVGLLSPPAQGTIDPAPYGFWSLYWGRPFTSRVTLGSIVEAPAVDTRPWCETRQDCAMLDGTHEFESLTCGSVPTTLDWHGPPGSALYFSCEGQLTVCPILAAEEADCSTQVEQRHVATESKGGACWYVMPDGTRGGSGRCVALQLIEDDD